MTVMRVSEDERAWLPRDREWTVDDLDGLSDDGLQYERRAHDEDLVLYPAYYASSGVTYYWTFDQDADPASPVFIAYALTDGTYSEVARATGDETVMVSTPYPVELCPAAIAAG